MTSSSPTLPSEPLLEFKQHTRTRRGVTCIGPIEGVLIDLRSFQVAEESGLLCVNNEEITKQVLRSPSWEDRV